MTMSGILAVDNQMHPSCDSSRANNKSDFVIFVIITARQCILLWLWCTTTYRALYCALCRALCRALSLVIGVFHVLHSFGVFTCFQPVVVFHVVEPQLHSCYCLFEIVFVTIHSGCINNRVTWYQISARTQRKIQLN